MRHICLTMLLLFSLFFVNGQTTFNKRKLTIYNEDSSRRFFTSPIIDEDGFLWYDTKKGLIKKMGKKKIFYPFNHPNQEYINNVTLLVLDAETIFGYCPKGFFLFDIATSKYKWLFIPEADSRFIAPLIDYRNNIWLTTPEGLIFRCSKEGKVKTYNLSSSLKHDFLQPLTVMEVLKDESLILKENQVIYRYKNGDLETLANFDSSKEREDLFDVFISENGLFFKKNSSGSFLFHGVKCNYKYVPEIDRQIFQIFFTKGRVGRIINTKSIRNIGSNRWKDLLLIHQNKIEILQANKESGFEIVDEIHFDNNVERFFLDKKNNLWVTILYKLIHISFQKRSGIQKILIENNIDYPGNFSARSITKTKNDNLYVLRDFYGLYEKVKEDSILRKISFKNLTGKKDVSSNYYGFLKLNDSILLAYGGFKYLLKLNIRQKIAIKIPIPIKDFKGKYLFDAERINNKIVLLGGKGVMFKLNLDQNLIVPYTIDKSIDISTKNIFDLFYDRKKNQLWMGLTDDGGLYKKDFTTGGLEHFHSKSNNNQILSNNINVIYPGDKDVIWVGTDSGLQGINAKTNQSDYFLNSQFRNNHVVSIITNNENIWFGTYNGLVRYDLRTKETQTFFIKDGLSNFEFNKKSFYKIDESSFLFGGISGLDKIKPLKRQVNKKTNSLFLRQVTYYNSKFKKDTIITNSVLNKVKEFDISYRNNYLFLSFAINDPLNEIDNKYRYKIDGVNKNWIDIGGNEELFLQGMKPGTYKIFIQGINSSNEFTNILKYNLTIENIFYKKTWFIICEVIALILLILIYLSYRKDLLRRKNRLYRIEAESLQSQMSPHFIFNILNSIQSVMILEGKEKAIQLLTSYSDLLRSSIDMQHIDFISLTEELNFLEAYLTIEKLRLNNLNFSINFAGTHKGSEIMIPCMLFQPLLENAIKHGLIYKKDNRDLRVDLKVQENYLIGKVIDNGVGRRNSSRFRKEANKSHKSWATEILKERIFLFKKIYSKKIIFEIIDLKNGQGIPTGTEAVLKIPISKKYK